MRFPNQYGRKATPVKLLIELLQKAPADALICATATGDIGIVEANGDAWGLIEVRNDILTRWPREDDARDIPEPVDDAGKGGGG